MKRNWWLVLGIIGMIMIVAGIGIWAFSLIDSIYAYRSPIANTPPSPEPAMGAPVTRRLVFVLIDGERVDTSLITSVMPTLNQLRQQGASAVMHSQTPSFSQAGYTVLLTGAWPYLSDGPAFNADYPDVWTFTQDDLFSAAHRAGLRTGISGYYWFEKLVPQQAVTDSFYTPGEDKKADEDVVAAALPWLEAGTDQLILIHLDQVDYAGHHEGGANKQSWLDASKRSDDLIKAILAKLDLSKDTILICSDHGHVNPGGHGGADPVVLIEPFIMAGAGVKPGVYPDIQMADIAPTLAALLGTNIPASAQGHVLTEMLDLPASELSVLPAIEKAQQTKLVEAYTTAIKRPISPDKLSTLNTVADFQRALEVARSSRLLLERVMRAIIAGLLLAGVVYFLIKRAGKKWSLLLDFAGINLALVILGYGIMTKWLYSFSTLEGQTQMIVFSVAIAGISGIILWLVYAFTQKIFKAGVFNSAFSTQGFFWGLLMILAIPMLINFTINGLLPTWTLPNISLSFIGLLAMLQMVLAAVVGLLLTGIAALFGKFAKK